MTETRRINSIQVGTRHRKDLGDLQCLADAIEAVGLLHPVVIDSRNRLIAGQRRLEAVKLLGWATVPVRLIDLDNLAEGEWIENTCRKDLLPSEIAAIARVLRPREQAKARQRQKARLKQGDRAPVPENCRHGEVGEVRDIVAQFAGISGRTLDKIEAVVEAAQENPEKYGHLVDEMDAEPRSVHRCHQKLQRLRRQQEAQADTVEAVAAGRYRLRENEVVCGDCREILPHIKDNTFHAVISDPPFGIGHDYNGRQETTDDPQGYWRWLRPIYQEMLRVLRPGGLVAVFQGGRYLRFAWDWFGPDSIVYAVCREPSASWRGGQPVACCWDPVVLRFKEGGPRYRSADFVRTRNWFLTDSRFDDLARIHSCPEPLDVCEELVRSFTCEGALVLDCFAGVGSIPIACSRLGRRYVGIEIDQEYVRVARKRMRLLGSGG